MIHSTLMAWSRMVRSRLSTINGVERVLLIKSPHVVPVKFRKAWIIFLCASNSRASAQIVFIRNENWSCGLQWFVDVIIEIIVSLSKIHLVLNFGADGSWGVGSCHEAARLRALLLHLLRRKEVSLAQNGLLNVPIINQVFVMISAPASEEVNERLAV